MNIVPDGPFELSLLVAVFGASLLGSLHCAGMCGPFVAVYSAGPGPRSPFVHVAYHVARGVGYVSLGALAGGLGWMLDGASRLSGWLHIGAAAFFVLVIGLGVSVFFPRLRVNLPLAPQFGQQLVKLRSKPRVVRASVLGGLTPFLPCGWLYAFVVVAAGTGGVLSGASVLLVFWVGTIPMLLGLGALLGRLGERLGRQLPRITGATLIVIGLLGVYTRVAPLFSETTEEVAPCH